MKIIKPLILLAFLILFSCEEEIPTDPFLYVGKYRLCETPNCSNGITVNNQSTQPGANTGIIQRFEDGKTIAHYEMLGTAFHIYEWNEEKNGGYAITYRDKDSFHIRKEDGTMIYFEKYK